MLGNILFLIGSGWILSKMLDTIGPFFDWGDHNRRRRR